MRVLLGPHGARLAGVRVEQHRGLLYAAAILQRLDLPAHFVVDGLLQEAEGIQVLDFATRAERISRSTHRDVGIAAERSFLHVAVADIDPAHQAMQGLGVGNGFLGRTHVRFGNDFQQRRSGTIEVDAAHAVKILVQGFSGIFFKVRAGEAHGLLTATGNDGDRAALHDRQIELADLVALGKIGIEIILAREYRATVDVVRDVAVDRQSEANGLVDGRAIGNGQHARQREIDRRRV